jgi:hypothetical protein
VFGRVDFLLRAAGLGLEPGVKLNLHCKTSLNAEIVL